MVSVSFCPAPHQWWTAWSSAWWSTGPGGGTGLCQHFGGVSLISSTMGFFSATARQETSAGHTSTRGHCHCLRSLGGSRSRREERVSYTLSVLREPRKAYFQDLVKQLCIPALSNLWNVFVLKCCTISEHFIGWSHPILTFTIHVHFSNKWNVMMYKVLSWIRQQDHVSKLCKNVKTKWGIFCF